MQFEDRSTMPARTSEPQELLAALGGQSLGKGGTHAACALPEAGNGQAADRFRGHNPLAVPAAAGSGIMRPFSQPSSVASMTHKFIDV